MLRYLFKTTCHHRMGIRKTGYGPGGAPGLYPVFLGLQVPGNVLWPMISPAEFTDRFF